MYNNGYPVNKIDSFDFSLRSMDGQKIDENSTAINISDVIEVIETDPAFGSMEPRRQLVEPEARARLVIIEQPASKALRFRYECEGRSAGSIPGVNSTAENKTYPTVQIVGFKGRAMVLASCVTKDSPYRAHPHNLVGKDGCKRGICTVEVNSENMVATFANLGIQCVKKRDIEEALRLREEIRMDPFRVGFGHKNQPSSIDLNSVRLCFQAFLEGPQRGKFVIPLPPVVSEPIYDKKAMADLVICKLSHCSASVAGGDEVILLCEKVAKEDITVRFYEEKDGQVIWEGYGDFTPSQVHKQVAIYFRTPRYKTIEIDHPTKVFIQLRRPSDNATSEALPFQLTPLDSGRTPFWSIRRSLGHKADYRTFANILQTNTRQLTKQKSPVITLDAVEEAPKQDANNNKEEIIVEDSIVCNKDVVEDVSNIVESNIENIDSCIDTVIQEDVPVEVSNESSHVLEGNKLEEDMEQGFDELLEQVKNLDNLYPEGNVSNDFGVYSSLQLAMKNPCDMTDFNQGYEDVVPPRPVASKPSLPQVKEVETDDSIPPLPPKRVKKAPISKTLPPVPEKTKLNIFQKLFSSTRRKKNKSREGSIISIESARSASVVQDDLTEAEHYALYTSVAPHATASEFDEMSFYYSPVEGQKVK